MKYKIYEIERSETLTKLENDESYKFMLTDISSIIFNKYYIDDEFDSVEKAHEFIMSNEEDFSGKDLTILPIISISW